MIHRRTLNCICFSNKYVHAAGLFVCHLRIHVEVVGFDTVDDESRSERRVVPAMPFPKDWKTDQNPPYAYYAFYIYANLYILNKFRELRGLNTFAFRPHCGEAGDSDHVSHSVWHFSVEWVAMSL